MPSVNPQLITNDLLEKLIPSIESGENKLGDFGLRVILREAKKIPDIAQSLLITGLAEIVGGNYAAAIGTHERLALIAPYNDTTWVNFAIAFGQKCQYKLARKISIESIPFADVSGLYHAFLNAGYWADLHSMIAIKNKGLFQSLEPSSLTDKQRGDIMRCETILSVLESDLEESKFLSEMALLVMRIAEEHSLPPRQTSVHTDAEGMLIFSFGVAKDQAEFVWDLNHELANLIVDNHLFSANSIATFHVIEA
ncbi:hypothetical protein LVQ79_10470 [Buttiauxella sp. A2-C1_F]|uniref:hypothetical protein n=1 Tax=Buttiauxella sp. A2-C1_F TaxID=2904526 RepID=UPI001E285F8B|nr:hypothetical protein [Buttiauxella sp. A2-C1_F]MCE0845968.1 hypothetical protein [Buttiauxella sp. A2-C1_F]